MVRLYVTAAAAALLAACSSTSVVNVDGDQVVVQAKSAKNLDSATKQATSKCKKAGYEMAGLERTEDVGGRAVAYFRCE